MLQKKWYPHNWLEQVTLQIPEYEATSLQEVKAQIYKLPELISLENITRFRKLLQRVYHHHGFILHAGDCAESFEDTVPEIIDKKLSHLRKLSSELSLVLNKPTICIARQAGQYAKPRTDTNEIINGKKLLAYRGDMINAITPTIEDRIPNAFRMLMAYDHSKAIMTYNHHYLSQHEAIYFSHEALLLHYEECMTRQHQNGKWFNASTHLPWVGMRTIVDSASHTEYASGIENPIAVKVGPNTSLSALSRMLKKLNPNNEEGKIVLIYRFGTRSIVECLPDLVSMLSKDSHKVLVLCDPMHGNTKKINQQKTRHPSDIYNELKVALMVHQKLSWPLHGLHIETTYENVDECVEIGETSTCYKSLVDPRLNSEQACRLFNEFVLHESRLNTLEVS